MAMELEQTQPNTQPGDLVDTSFDDPTLVLTLQGVGGSGVWWELRQKPVGDQKWVIGRSEKADFRINANKKRVSQNHCVIWATSEPNPLIMIKDTSTNGTFLNNNRLQKGVNCMLVTGDKISIANEVVVTVILPSKRTVGPTTEGVGAHYELADLLGQGAFAKVRLAIHRSTGKKYACKIIEKTRVNHSVSVQREINVLQTVQHENIVSLKECFEDATFYYLIMDYVPYGDLMTHIEREQRIAEPISREIMRQVLKAIAFVHDSGVSHRDLKPENILVASMNPIKVQVTDFGLAKFSGTSCLKTFCGTLSYLAPEVLMSRNGKAQAQGYSSLVDMWSVGCLAYVILTGYMPFDGATQEELYNGVLTGTYNARPLTDANLSLEAQDFIRKLLEVDPKKRYTAYQALQHPWITGSYVDTQSLNDEPSSEIAIDRLDIERGGRLPSAIPSLDAEYDSDLDDVMAEPRSARDAASVQSDGVRFDNFQVDDELIPENAWLKLNVTKESVPSKDYWLTKEMLFFGRDATTMDIILPVDQSVSRQHFAIKKIMNSQGLWEAWLYAFSRVTLNYELTKENTRCRIYDSDDLALWFLKKDNQGSPKGLRFQVEFLDKDHFDWVRKSAHLNLEPIPQCERLKSIAPESSTRQQNKPAKRGRESSFGLYKETKPAT